MRSELIEIASVAGGKYHRLADKRVTREDGWKPRLMLCGRILRPLNYFVTEQSADRHTGGRYTQYACAQCAAAIVKGPESAYEALAGLPCGVTLPEGQRRKGELVTRDCEVSVAMEGGE